MYKRIIKERETEKVQRTLFTARCEIRRRRPVARLFIKTRLHLRPWKYDARLLDRDIICGIPAAAVVLVEMDRVMDKLGQVQAVKPDDGILIPAFFIGPFLTVVVPAPRGSNDNIARTHANTLTLHRSEAPLALDDETDSKCGMAMCRGRLTRHDKLQASIQSIGGVGSSCFTLC